MKTFGLAVWGGDELLIAFIALGASAAALYQWVHPVAAVVPLVPLAIVVYFFRDPNRSGTSEPEILLAPADGTVSDIEELDESSFIQGRALRIGIFLSPFNVHVNRTPCGGRVSSIEYRQGEFLPAYNPEAPNRNESISLGLTTDEGLRILVKQVTGILARRIVCDTQVGAQLERGQRYGMIKFGSRTEVYVPIEAQGTPLVKIGDKVAGGTTPLCRIKIPHVMPQSEVAIAAKPVTPERIAEAQRVLDGLASSSGMEGN